MKNGFLFLNLLFIFSSLAEAEKLPVEAFASPPSMSHVQLSPSGKKVLFLSDINETYFSGTIVNVYDTDKGELSRPLSASNDKFKINWVTWAGDDKLLVSSIFPATRYGTPTTETRLLVKDLKNNETKNILSNSFFRKLAAYPQFQDDVIDHLPNEPNSILLSVSRNHSHSPAVYKIDLNTLKRSIKQKPKPHVNTWVSDQQNRVRAGIRWEGTEYRLITKSLGEKKWRERHTFEAFQKDYLWPMGFDKDPNFLYYSAYHNGFKAIFKTDLREESIQKTLVFSDENYDVDGSLIYSNKTGEAIGTTYSQNGGFTFWDEDYKSLKRGIDKVFPDTNNYILGFSQDESKYVLKTSSDTNAGTYYIGDRNKKSVSVLGHRFEQLPIELMAKKKSFNYKARDGLEIQGFVSLPNNYKDNTKIPTIVFPHGGPISYDDAGFDYWTQFFANRGYAVLQMNFRGSSGYGYNFMKAGLQNWGKAMQDDVEDGIRALIQEGIADKNKICIAGASYGGYAALMGAVKTPDLYKCVISFAGVTDMAYLAAKARAYTNYEIFKEQIGSKRSLLKEVSPVNHVKAIKAPVLLIHGDQDRRVSVKHSQKMMKKMEKENKQVSYIELEDGDHYLTKNEHRITTFKAIDAFLEKHLPVNPQ